MYRVYRELKPTKGSTKTGALCLRMCEMGIMLDTRECIVKVPHPLTPTNNQSRVLKFAKTKLLRCMYNVFFEINLNFWIRFWLFLGIALVWCLDGSQPPFVGNTKPNWTLNTVNTPQSCSFQLDSWPPQSFRFRRGDLEWNNEIIKEIIHIF